MNDTELRVRASLMQKACGGTPEEQARNLVAIILDTFRTPERWPMTDSERCTFLRTLYRLAVNVEHTEKAMKCLTP